MRRLLADAVRFGAWNSCDTHGVDASPNEWICTPADLERLLTEISDAGVRLRSVSEEPDPKQLRCCEPGNASFSRTATSFRTGTSPAEKRTRQAQDRSVTSPVHGARRANVRGPCYPERGGHHEWPPRHRTPCPRACLSPLIRGKTCGGNVNPSTVMRLSARAADARLRRSRSHPASLASPLRLEQLARFVSRC